MNPIKKINVTQGVFWIEIPEAEVYILCGCPADSVKHLMKRGLIVSVEQDGISWETGPNAILLSDVLLQNGEFSNMAEFPVLQMLYRQGMLLPGHPNNRGLKPVLIGLKEQVEAQLEYIYRGNYGLTSESELVQAGASAEQAREMMAMKLKFAFGEIRKSEEFLDSRVIRSDPVEIRNGVFIRRLQMNVFEIKYGDASVTVDLNLSPYSTYPSPYPLNFHNITREYFAVLHVGEGDGWDINRPSMSSILMFHGKIYLIDAGPNTTNNLTALGIGINEIEGLFHTHSHDDHFAGLTTLLRADRRIKYYATRLVRDSVAKKLAALLSFDERNFSHYFDVADLQFDTWNPIDGMEVKPVFSPHPVETNLFIFRSLYENGYRTYAHYADIVSLDVLEKMVGNGDPGSGISRNFYNRTRKNYLVPADLKKLDIGGGMIHGTAKDFKEDPSEKIILAHTALPLTEGQKEIGSGAPFGTIDRLIHSHRDYLWQFAYKYLKSYFPGIPDHQLQILLNNPVVEFNPASIIVKDNETYGEIYLVLTGMVEIIKDEKMQGLLYGGSLIGEISGITGRTSEETFRSANFVKALKIPTCLYNEFIHRNHLAHEIERLQNIRETLEKSWLFGEGISHAVKNKLARAVRSRKYKADTVLENTKLGSVHLLIGGGGERFNADGVFDSIGAGDFFGEDSAVFGATPLFGIRFLEPTSAFEISGNILGDIPIVRWKLYEIYRKHRRQIMVRSNFSITVPDLGI